MICRSYGATAIWTTIAIKILLLPEHDLGREFVHSRHRHHGSGFEKAQTLDLFQRVTAPAREESAFYEARVLLRCSSSLCSLSGLEAEPGSNLPPRREDQKRK